MATRTLADFRAEHNVWRKDLAGLLSISEAELARLEEEKEVPADIAQKIIDAYRLPADYFTVDPDALAAAQRAAAAQSARITPEKPIPYLMKVGFVWMLLVMLVQTAITMPFSFLSAAGAGIAQFLDVVYDIVTAAIMLSSGIPLSRYIIKNTTFRGRIADFALLYAFVPNATGWILLPLAVRATDAGILSVRNLAYMAAGLPILVLHLVFLAFFLKAAAEADTEKGHKAMTILLAVCLGSQVLYCILYAALGRCAGYTPLEWIDFGFQLLVFALVCYGAAFGIYKQPKLKKLWLTALPIAYCVIPEALSIVGKWI